MSDRIIKDDGIKGFILIFHIRRIHKFKSNVAMLRNLLAQSERININTFHIFRNFTSRNRKFGATASHLKNGLSLNLFFYSVQRLRYSRQFPSPSICHHFPCGNGCAFRLRRRHVIGIPDTIRSNRVFIPARQLPALPSSPSSARTASRISSRGRFPAQSAASSIASNRR